MVLSRRISDTTGNMEAEESKGVAKGRTSDRYPRSILDLPHHLNMEILFRLPLKTLIKCRCVCKFWKIMLSDHDFAKLHLSRTPKNLMYAKYPEIDESVHLIDLRGAKSDCSKDAMLKLTKKYHFPEDPDYCLTKSCNGLVCLRDLENMEPTYICNPILGEYVTLPKPLQGIEYFAGFEFGFCYDTNQYKVVRTQTNAPYETEIYALGDGQWRSIGNAPLSFCLILHLVNTLVNGVVYWMDDGKNIEGFHFGNEQFLTIDTPIELRSVRDKCSNMCLGEFHGFLSILCPDYESHNLNIWVLKECWTKAYTIDISLLQSDVVFQSIMSMDGGELLMQFNETAIVMYSPYWQGFRSLNQMYEIRSKFNAMLHVPSFISLKDVAKGEEVLTLEGMQIMSNGKD